MYWCIDVIDIMLYIIKTMKKHYTLLYHVPNYDVKKIPVEEKVYSL